MKNRKNIMDFTENILLITYFLKRSVNAQEIEFTGCKEIRCFDYELPSYIKGLIKYDDDYIPVVDPNIYFQSQPSMINNLACILIIESIRNCCKYRTGIIIEDIDEILNFAAGNYRNMPYTIPLTFNMNFIIDVLRKGQSEQFLFNTHKLLNIHEKRNSIVKNHLVECNYDVIGSELVENTGIDEFDFFNTNEFLVTN